MESLNKVPLVWGTLNHYRHGFYFIFRIIFHLITHYVWLYIMWRSRCGLFPAPSVAECPVAVVRPTCSHQKLHLVCRALNVRPPSKLHLSNEPIPFHYITVLVTAIKISLNTINYYHSYHCFHDKLDASKHSKALRGEAQGQIRLHTLAGKEPD